MTDHADLVARLRARAASYYSLRGALADYGGVDADLDREAADALSAPAVTEEMVERFVATLNGPIGGVLLDTTDNEIVSSCARAILTAALGTPAAGHETYPGHGPAAGLPQPSTEKGGDANSDGSLDHGPDNAQPRSPETDGADPGDFVDHAFGPYIRSSETSGEVPTLTETLYRDIFAEITAKATPLEFSATDPDHITAYRVPVGPIHRAAGKLGFQMFDGERYLAEARKALADCNAHEGAIRAEAAAKEREWCAGVVEERANDIEAKSAGPMARATVRTLRALAAGIRGGSHD